MLTGTVAILIVLFSLRAQNRGARQIDEWEALDLSLKQKSMKSDLPRVGFVPDERTATTIAEAVAAALYGAKRTAEERPFRARLKGEVWTVMGIVHPANAAGGTAVIQLSKKDGRVLFAVHQY
jgi:hypothetical protein